MDHWLDILNKHGSPRNQIDPDDGWLLERKDWPQDFQFYLSVANGYNFEDEPALNVRIPIPWNDRRFFYDQLCCVYGQKTSADELSRGWLTVTDISMPKDTFAIAKFESSSLAVLSLREKDFGCVYYWDWYRDYPWRGDFFEHRLEPVYERYEDQLDEIFDVGESHPLYPVINEAANDVILVKLADSFEAFVSMIQIGSNE